MRRPMKLATGVALSLLLTATAACSGGSDDKSDGEAPVDTVEVLASASLSDVLAELGRRFQAAHAGTKVDFSFSSSNELAERVRYVPADLVATADEETLQPLLREGLVSEPTVFARNRLVILVPKGNPLGIRTLADLARPDVKAMLCAPTAPCGRLAAQALDRAGVKVTPKSHEANVRALVARLGFGEADAGLVFATNVRDAADRLEAVELPAEQNVSRPFPMAKVRQAKNIALADAFTAFVLSEPARPVLAEHGLLPP